MSQKARNYTLQTIQQETDFLRTPLFETLPENFKYKNHAEI